MPKKGVFSGKTLGKLTYMEWHLKEEFWWAFFTIFWEKNTHNFVKSDVKFENKCLFHATLSPIFTCRTSFYPESSVAFNKIMKSQKLLSLWGLGPRNYIWVTWSQKMYQAITPELYHQFSHTGSHFIQNQVAFNKINLRKFLHIEV